MSAAIDSSKPVISGDIVAGMVASGVLTRSDGDRLSRALAQGSGSLVDTVVGLGILNEEAIADAIAQQLSLGRLTDTQTIDLELDVSRVTSRFQELNCVVVSRDRSDADLERPLLIMRDPTDFVSVEAVRFALRKNVPVLVATQRQLEALRSKTAASLDQDLKGADDLDTHLDLERLRESASDAPIVKLVNDLIAEAVEAGASDLHFDPQETRLVVRRRLDGVLSEVRVLPISQLAPVSSRLKIMAALDIGERRLPQDGAISANVRGRMIDLRVATAPSVRGQAVVVRILNQSRVQLDLAALGLDPVIVEQIKDVLQNPNGLFLVTGPTGSGKSTTLYAALRLLNDGQRKILTVEDPVEFKLDGLSQIQVKPDIGLTFASALRSMLRHDPDVILVGEIRDPETAKIAVQAALTGHLVLASLHTNSAVAAVDRLRDMGIESFLIASTLNGVLAQRLMRRTCDKCRAIKSAAEIGATCSACDSTGFSGRLAVAEFLKVDATVRAAISEGRSGVVLTDAARAGGLRPLSEVAQELSCRGVTTSQEAARLISSL